MKYGAMITVEIPDYPEAAKHLSLTTLVEALETHVEVTLLTKELCGEVPKTVRVRLGVSSKAPVT